MCNAFIMQMVLRNVFFVDRRLVTLKISNFLMVLWQSLWNFLWLYGNLYGMSCSFSELYDIL